MSSFCLIGSKLAKKIQEPTKLGPRMKITVLGGNGKSLAHFHRRKEIGKEERIQIVRSSVCQIWIDNPVRVPDMSKVGLDGDRMVIT